MAYLSRTAREGIERYAARMRPSPPASLERGAGTPARDARGPGPRLLAEDTVVAYASDPPAARAGIADEVDVRLVPGSWTDRQLLSAPGSAALAAALADVPQTVP